MPVIHRHGYAPRPPPGHRDRHRNPRNPGAANTDQPPQPEERMSAEDLRTWSMAYTLSIDVYVCAERYLIKDFKACIAASVITNFEMVGLDAAQPSVLESCKTLHNGVSLMDPLLKKIFARVGFLQARLWKNFPEETSNFFMDNPELSTLILKEMAERREEDVKDDLPAMDRPLPVQPPREMEIIQGPRRRNYGPMPPY